MNAYDVAYAFAALAVICLTLAAVGFVSSMPDPADAQPDFTPLDEKWYATAALDPRDRADLANLPECLTPRHVDHPGLACWEFDELNKQLFADPPPWMAERLIEETETYLQEHSR